MRPRLLAAGDVVGRWRVGKLLGRGRFGEVYAGVEQASGTNVAIKVEQEPSQTGRRSRLRREARVYTALKGTQGWSQLHWHGAANGLRALVSDRLGPSLKALHRAVGPLTAQELALVASEALSRLETLHGRGWLHGDIKPDNLLLPLGVNALEDRSPGVPLLHCIDFGLSLALPPGSAAEGSGARRGTLGAVRYASINNQLLQPLGPRDDLEALAFSLVFLHRGRLPWSDVTAPTQPERFELIRQAKARESPDSLFAGLPGAFAEFLRGCRELDVKARPDYASLRRLFSDLQRGGGAGQEAPRTALSAGDG